jgi:hypothetical protein
MPLRASNLAPSRQRLLTFVSPSVADIIFMESVDAQRMGAAPPAYGTPHPDTKRWPDHVLVFVKTADEQGLVYQFFYAAKREEQDKYNYEIGSDDRLVRTYVLKRSEYPDSSVLPTPVVGSADALFGKYVFAFEFLDRSEQELDSIFVVLKRVYSMPETVSYEFDRSVDRMVRVTRTIIPAGSETGSATAGRTVEIAPQNTFFDLRVTSEVVFEESDLDGDGDPNYPLSLTTVATFVNYDFPPRLNYVEMHGTWAFADSTTHQASYSEDFFFELDFTEPPPGPYAARVLRFVTDAPEEMLALPQYQLDKVIADRDTFGMLRYWWRASTKGNSTFALARQQDVGRACVHSRIELPKQINYVAGSGEGGEAPSAGGGPGRQYLPETDGYQTFISKNLLNAAIEVKQTAHNLFEVQVVQLYFTGTVESAIYGGPPPTKELSIEALNL